MVLFEERPSLESEWFTAGLSSGLCGPFEFLLTEQILPDEAKGKFKVFLQN